MTMEQSNPPALVRLSEGLGPNVADDERERTSYLTADEVQAAQTLHKRAPFALCNVSMGFFSIARYYGGLTLQGCHYTYMPGHDECVRDDVLRLVTKLRKKPASKKPAPAPQPMLDLGA
jgi:hypothetical protein